MFADNLLFSCYCVLYMWHTLNVYLSLKKRQTVNIPYLYCTSLVIVGHSKWFYSTGFALTQSHTYSYTGGSVYPAGSHLLIRSVKHSHTHTLIDAQIAPDAVHQEQFGSQCSRTLQNVKYRFCDPTWNFWSLDDRSIVWATFEEGSLLCVSS